MDLNTGVAIPVVPVVAALVAVVGAAVLTGPIRRPLAELAIKAVSVAAEGARGFLRAVDQATDAALDLVTQVLPRAASNTASSAADRSAAICHSASRVLRRSATKFRKNRIRLVSSDCPSVTAEAASFVLTCTAIVASTLFKAAVFGVLQAWSFLSEIPDIVPLVVLLGLTAGIIQMLAFHAADLLWQMYQSPTDDWIQMTAFEKVQDVGQYLVKVAPYLPESTQGMMMLILTGLSYELIFFCLLSPDCVDFEFSLEPAKEFFAR